MIRLNALGKRVPGKDILQDISCEIQEGLTFIVGDSGAGKSTLLNLIGTLDDFSSGEILYEKEGERFSYASSDELEKESFRSRHIGMVFQAANLIEGLNSLENVELSMHLAGRKTDSDAITASLQELGITDPQKPVDVFSGGEKQRVAIARALVKGADIILADEPTGNLDSGNTDKVFSLLKDISPGRHVLVVTHNEEKARQYADRILVMQDGRLAKDEIIHEPPQESTVSPRETAASASGIIPRGLIRKMSLKNIRRFKGKFLSMALVLGLAFAVVAGLIAVNYYLDDEINNLNKAYFDADVINVFNSNIENVGASILTGYMRFGVPFSEEEIAVFQNRSELAAVVPLVEGYYIPEGLGKYIQIKQIQLNDFFRNRIMNDSVEGSFPEKDNEIILGEDVARDLFKEDCIGRELSIKDIWGNSIAYTVVGINHYKNVDGIFFNYVSADSIRNSMSYKAYMISLFHKPYTDKLFEDTDKTISPASAAECFVSAADETAAFVFGNKPAADYEIAVSLDVFSDIYYELSGEFYRFSLREFEEMGEHVREALALVTGEEYYLPMNELYTVRICAVHNYDETRILVSPGWYDTIMPVMPQKLQCYTADMDIAKEFNAENYPSGYEYQSYYHERFATAVETTDVWTVLMICIVGVVMLLVIFLTMSFARISVTERSYETGVIKALGAGRKSLYRMLLQDQLYLGAAAGIGAALFYVLFIILLPLVTKDSISNWMVISLCLLALLCAPMLVCILFSSFKIRKALKSKPVEDIRNRM